MKYIIAVAPFIGLIAIHNAWRSFECPLLLSMAACIIIKVKSNEQREKKKH